MLPSLHYWRIQPGLTQQLLGWKPEELGLIDDLEAGHYFEVPQPVVR